MQPFIARQFPETIYVKELPFISLLKEIHINGES